jgi:hypothetical protein
MWSFTMPTYSHADFDRIGAAIGKDGAEVAKCEDRFESAACWYRTLRGAPERVAHSVMRKRMTKIANAAQKLLRHLQIYDYRKAPDGPGDIALLEFLSGDSASEDNIIEATAAVGRLMEVFDAIDAAQTVERAARQAVDDAERLSRLTGLKGRSGDLALNVWIADLMSVFKTLTGRDPRMSTVSSGPDQGKPSGPFVRFLEAAAAPVEFEGQPLCLRSIRERARSLQESSADQN